MQSCPSRDEWLRRVDGEVTANRAAELEVHLRTCGLCTRETAQLDDIVRALRAPTTIVGHATVARVMTHLDDPRERVPRRRWSWFAAGGFAVAAAAAMMFVLLQREPVSELQSRGTIATRDLGHHIGIEVYALGTELHPLADGARVSRSTMYLASYRNLGDAPAFALVFAIDSAREVHWLYPAYSDVSTDPVAVQLSPTRTSTLFADAVAFDEPAAGSLTLVELISDHPLHVSQIERVAPPMRTPAGLRARFPGVVIRTVTLDVAR